MCWIRRILTSALVLIGLAVAPLHAQSVGVVQSEILVLDPERLFEGSQLGQRILSELQTAREDLIARNRRIEAELEEQEQDLTDLRPTISPEEFRQLADEFDRKVQEMRRDSERRVRDLERNRERAPIDFLRQVEPIVIEVMREAGGVVVMDARSVLFRADVIDITDLMIARLNEEIGEGVPQDGANGQAQPGEEAQQADDPETQPAQQQAE